MKMPIFAAYSLVLTALPAPVLVAPSIALAADDAPPAKRVYPAGGADDLLKMNKDPAWKGTDGQPTAPNFPKPAPPIVAPQCQDANGALHSPGTPGYEACLKQPNHPRP